MTTEREERTKWLEIWIPPGWTDDARIQFWDGEDWGHECHFDSFDLQSIPRHTDAEHDERNEEIVLLAALVTELKAKLELRAMLAERFCSSCERTLPDSAGWQWDGDACEGTCPECTIKWMSAELEQTMAKLDGANMALLVCVESNDNLRAELARLKEDAPPVIYDSNAKMWILAGAVLLRNQAGELLGIVRASDYYEKDREKK